MRAATAGFYTFPWGRHPRVQILTIDELTLASTTERAADASTGPDVSEAVVGGRSGSGEPAGECYKRRPSHSLRISVQTVMAALCVATREGMKEQ